MCLFTHHRSVQLKVTLPANTLAEHTGRHVDVLSSIVFAWNYFEGYNKHRSDTGDEFAETITEHEVDG